MWPQWMNMLAWWQWTILAAIPPAVILLYFLKLKRRPVEVPSTYLWQRSIEDMHVNSIWQRLRRNLLLFLQLLIIFLAMLALLRPGCRGHKLIGNRFVFLIDNSASMSATDQKPTRLDEAKRRAAAMIDEMRSGDVGMVVSFADTARVEQMFTDNRRRLRQAVEAVEPTSRSTSLSEALKVASGLANPASPGLSSSSSSDESVTPAAEALPATVYVLSDGRFQDVSNFSWGNLTLVYMRMGIEKPANVAVLAFSVRRHETRADRLQAFARLENFGDAEVSLTATLRLDGAIIDAAKVKLAAGASEGVVFDLGAVDSGGLELSLDADDDLAVDNNAYAEINLPQKARVLLVTPGNEPLELALATPLADELAEVTIEQPGFLEKKQYQTAAQSGGYDLIIYDRCRPKEMPQANTFFIGETPPDKSWSAGEPVDVPNIIDVDPAHPVMQWIAMDDVLLHEGRPLVVPPGGTTLIDTHAGPMMAIAPREGFEDLVEGFMLVESANKTADQEAGVYARTNWPIRPSFPVFIFNVLEYLGGSRQVTTVSGVRPGQPVVIDSPATADSASGGKISVRNPAGKRVNLKESRPGKYNFTDSEEPGIYEAIFDGKPFMRFSVNLFDANESDIAPREAFGAGTTAVEGQSGWEESRVEFWRWLVLAGLVILLLEWYIYNRRVYL